MAGFPGNFSSEVKHMCVRERVCWGGSVTELFRGTRSPSSLPRPDVLSGWKGREDQVGKDKFVQHLVPSPIHAILLLSRPLRRESSWQGKDLGMRKSINSGGTEAYQLLCILLGCGGELSLSY